MLEELRFFRQTWQKWRQWLNWKKPEAASVIGEPVTTKKEGDENWEGENPEQEGGTYSESEDDMEPEPEEASGTSRSYQAGRPRRWDGVKEEPKYLSKNSDYTI